MNNRSLLLATTLLLSSSAALPAIAADAAKHQDPAPTAQASPALSASDLVGILRGLGYEVGTTGTQSYEIEMKQGVYNLRPIVALSPSGKKVWITQSVRTMSADDMVNADLMLKLLKANSAIGPAQFYVENVAAEGKPADWRLSFGYPVDNRGITAEVLRAALDSFASSLVENATIWDNAAVKQKSG